MKTKEFALIAALLASQGVSEKEMLQGHIAASIDIMNEQAAEWFRDAFGEEK